MLRRYVLKLRTRRALRFLRQYDVPQLTLVIAPYVGRQS